jgi:hypothetical protein
MNAPTQTATTNIEQTMLGPESLIYEEVKLQPSDLIPHPSHFKSPQRLLLSHCLPAQALIDL